MKKQKRKNYDVGIFGLTELPTALNEIHHDDRLDIDYDNAVRVNKYEVKALKNRANLLSKKVSTVMMMRAASHVASFMAAADYSKAVLEDCFGVSADVDEGPLHAISNLASLDVIHVYIKKSRLPISVKKEFMYTLTKQLAEQSATAMAKSSSLRTNNVRAIVVSNGNKNTISQVNGKLVSSKKTRR